MTDRTTATQVSVPGCQHCSPWRARALAAEAELAKRRRLGRKAARPRRGDEIGQLVARAREMLKLSVKGLAERIGCDPSRLAPSGQRKLTAEHINRIREIVALLPSVASHLGAKRRRAS